MKQLVLATGNSGKLEEMNSLLATLDIEVLPQSRLNIPEADETGLSFVENAILKARNAAHYSGLPAIADDSGLEVDALAGAPGIYSSRYAGPEANDKDNVRKLLHELRDIAPAERNARFQCVIVYMTHEYDPTPLICQGSWEGYILPAPQGDKGFGYDPVFYVAEQQCSAAELDAAVKNRLSHRGQALQQFISAMRKTYRPQP